MSLTPSSVLKEIFGYHSFVGNQEQIINHVLQNKSALAMMPTGGGKSLCYQIPALILPNITVVVSPLLALMQDQSDNLKNIGISAVIISSNLTATEYINIIKYIKTAKVKIIYTTPERAVSNSFIDLLFSVKISLFAIDEAHCVSHWGHDFRAEYQQLSIFKHKFPQVPIIALTATADNSTKLDILTSLRINNAKIFTQSFNRPNIYYLSIEKKNAKQQVLTFLKQNKFKTGIIYCNSRQKVDDIHDFLDSQSLLVCKYHAGMTIAERNNSHRAFLTNNYTIMIATIAFGLGIDKPDVRFVYHLDLPKSLENFYQESGRAGRDGLPALSVINYSLQDCYRLMYMITNSENSPEKKQLDLEKLNQVMQFCDSIVCKRVTLLKSLQEDITPCGNCDVCNNSQLEDMSVLAQKILSTIYKVNGKFGSKHIIDILKGKANYQVQIWDHHQLSTFGLASEYHERDLKRVIRQLYSQQFINIDPSSQQIKLNHKSLTILKGITNFTAHKPLYHHNSYSQQQNLLTELETRILFDLNHWRQSLAIHNKSSLHSIINDKIILEIVKKKPTTLITLTKVAGIGRLKIDKFGLDIIKIIKKHF